MVSVEEHIETVRKSGLIARSVIAEDRRKKILQLHGDGLKTKDIAEKLGISATLVKLRKSEMGLRARKLTEEERAQRNRDKYSRWYSKEGNKEKKKQWEETNKDKRNSLNRERRSTDDGKRKERNTYLKGTFGITLSDYESMLESQGGTCAICDGHTIEGRSLAVDHDHETGEIRGLLCWHCNVGLGYFRDSPESLRKAACYLESDSVR